MITCTIKSLSLVTKRRHCLSERSVVIVMLSEAQHLSCRAKPRHLHSRYTSYSAAFQSAYNDFIQFFKLVIISTISSLSLVAKPSRPATKVRDPSRYTSRTAALRFAHHKFGHFYAHLKSNGPLNCLSGPCQIFRMKQDYCFTTRSTTRRSPFSTVTMYTPAANWDMSSLMLPSPMATPT